jgi:hypothetical protein
LLAQSVEQRTFNPLVAGSNPAQPTIDHRAVEPSLIAQSPPFALSFVSLNLFAPTWCALI